jgi:ribonuclease HI
MYLILTDNPFYTETWADAKKAVSLHRCTCKKNGVLFKYPEFEPTSAAVYVDGGCILNRSSFAAVAFETHGIGIAVGGDIHTAPFSELSALKLALDEGASNCFVFTDSGFVFTSFLLGFPQDFKYAELGAEIRAKLIEKNVRVKKVKGHSGIIGNERADALCTDVLRDDVKRILREYTL